MNDADFAVGDVLDGIAAAHAVGLAPVKVNMVVKRGTNDSEIVPMARHFKGSGAVLRFIEYMDVGTSNGWNMTEVLPSADVVTRIAEHFPLVPLEAHSAAETAQRWGYVDGSGEIGVISSVTRAFCGSCTRARLSTEGKLYLCLFASSGHDLRALLRNGASDAEIATAIAEIWQGRGDRYSQLRGSASSRLARAGLAAASKCRTSAAERPAHASRRANTSPACCSRAAAACAWAASTRACKCCTANRSPPMCSSASRRKPARC